MSRSAKILLAFDRRRGFQLGIGELEELQELCDAGPEELFQRIGTGRWRTQDIQETLRLGLIGAGETANAASVLVERYAGPGQLLEWKSHCRAILMAAMAGHEDEPGEDDDDAGETKGETPTGDVSPGQSSVSAPSTE